jgi:hypothetical protein
MKHYAVAGLLLVAVLVSKPVAAQELAPRAYWPMPNDLNVLVLAYQHKTGDVAFDAALSIEGVEAEIDLIQVGYQRSYNMFGRKASVQVSVPFADGDIDGFVQGEYQQRRTVGAADALVRFGINLRGAPAMDDKAFRTMLQNPRTIVGASLTIQAPTGKYDSNRAINLGTNRWAVRPAVGMIVPVRPSLLFELELSSWVIGDNDDYLGGKQEQDPIIAVAAHLVKRLRPGLWASLDANFYKGGETEVDGQVQNNMLRNSRLGATLVAPLGKGHALRANYSTGVSTRFGGDFDTFTLTYLYAW